MRAPMLITAFLVYVSLRQSQFKQGKLGPCLKWDFWVPSCVPTTMRRRIPSRPRLSTVCGRSAMSKEKNIHVEFRVPRKPDDVAEMAADLVNRKVDVIATTGPQPIEAARRATNTIPIVIIACDRADRLVNSIARPGGNITGMACISSDLALKRLQLMQQVLPGLTHLAVLFNGGVPAKVAELQDITAAAKTLEVEVHPADVRDVSEYTTAFAAIKARKPDGLLILADPLTFQHLKEIAEFAAGQRLPSMYGFREFCDAGGLLCYGTNLNQQARRYGYFIDKILKGTRPGDIPVEEPTTHDLIINARTAKLLGLSIPNSILVSADQVIE